jgi:hypothetical protein
MHGILILLLLIVCSAKAEVLFHDSGHGYKYRFESNQKSIEGKITRQEIVVLALNWAIKFYRDESLEVGGLEFQFEPLQFWLVTFKKAGTDEALYAVVLPDGKIVEPLEEKRM